MNEYLFDVKLFASVRVQARSIPAAREKLRAAFDCASINAGAWPNGDPILGEASQDGAADLIEINGRDVA